VHSNITHFSALVYCGQMVGWIKITLDTELGLYPRSSPQEKADSSCQKGGTAAAPNSRPMQCSQTAEWIKMPQGTEVDLGSGDIVLGGDPVPLPTKRGTAARPHFSVHVLWPIGWMDQDVTWYRRRPRPMPYVLDGEPFLRKRDSSHPHFSIHVYCGQRAG